VTADYRDAVADMKAKYLVAHAKLAEFKDAGGENWETFKAGVEGARNELEAAFKEAGELVARNPRRFRCGPAKDFPMLWTVAVILLVLWALGMVSSYTLGGFIHILLVVAVVVVLVRIIQGRRIVV